MLHLYGNKPGSSSCCVSQKKFVPPQFGPDNVKHFKHLSYIIPLLMLVIKQLYWIQIISIGLHRESNFRNLFLISVAFPFISGFLHCTMNNKFNLANSRDHGARWQIIQLKLHLREIISLNKITIFRKWKWPVANNS